MKISKFIGALAAVALMASAAFAQTPNPPYQPYFLNPTSGLINGVTADASCMVVKYVGAFTPGNRPTVEVAAGGDMTFKINGVADATTGSPTLNGVFDLSTPAAAVDTMGELVSLINTTGANWRAALTSCLASDFTDNAIDTLAITDASSPRGVALTREATSASATTTFSVQVAALPPGADTNMAFYLTGRSLNTNPFSGLQPFVQFVREKVTSAGTIGLFSVLGVTRTYDTTGKVSEVVRTIYSETGAATTVEKSTSFLTGPLVGAPGEILVVRQQTATANMTAASGQITGYLISRKPQ